MSFTDKENIVLKDKLGGVNLPPVEEGWAKMSEMMEANPPVQTGWLSNLGRKFGLYLNTLFAVLVVTSSAYIYSAISSTNKAPLQIVASDLNSVFAANYFLGDLEVEEYSDALPTLEREEDLNNNNQQQKPNYTPAETLVIQNQIPAEATLPPIVEVKDSITEPEIDLPLGAQGLHVERWEDERKFSRAEFGFVGGLQIMPEVAIGKFHRGFSGGVFYREYFTPQKAFQIEALYVPVSFRPITYVERSQINNLSVIDSAQAHMAQYLSIPFTLHHQFRDNLSFSAGIQYSRLLRIKGSLTTIITGTQGPETQSTEFERIKNVDAFAKNDWAIVSDINYQFEKRLSIGIRLQQSLVDISKPKIGSGMHLPRALQFKASYIVGSHNKLR